MNVEKLSENAREQMISQGYSVLTAWYAYKSCFLRIVEFHHENGKNELDDALVDLYRKRARFEFTTVTMTKMLIFSTQCATASNVQ